jgi:phospholipid/cholesterol/gamma-HCH transport system substrate-binding protein
MTDTLHNVDRLIVNNESTIKDGLLSFESYTASLKSKGDAIERVMARADDAFAGFDSVMAKIDNAIPGVADGKTEELYEKVKALREMADTFRQKSDKLMEESRQTLADLSEAANNMTRKMNPAAAPAPAAAVAPRRPPQQKRP